MPWVRLISDRDGTSSDQCRARQNQINLALSSLFIAAESNPDLDVALYMGRIGEITERIKQKVQIRISLFDSLYSLNELLFDEMGFEGNVGNYYDIRNSLLNEVLDRKLGIPITLAIIYMEVAKRVGIPLTGINMSGHFLLSAGERDSLIFIDPFRKGRLFSRWECLRLLSGNANPPSDRIKLDQLERKFLPRADNNDVLVRLLNNMKMVPHPLGQLRRCDRSVRANPLSDAMELA